MERPSQERPVRAGRQKCRAPRGERGLARALLGRRACRQGDVLLRWGCRGGVEGGHDGGCLSAAARERAAEEEGLGQEGR